MFRYYIFKTPVDAEASIKKKGFGWFLCAAVCVLLTMTGCTAADNQSGMNIRIGADAVTQETAGTVTAQEEPDDCGTERSDSTDNSGERTAYVYICGAVMAPGVYEMPAGSRICDVLSQAGGFTSLADSEAVNLALPVTDGMQIVIPTFEDEERARQQAEEDALRLAAAREGMVNINTATKEQLMTLSGIGETRATDIITFREQSGGFETIEDIMRVPGIKESVFQKIRDLIYVE